MQHFCSGSAPPPRGEIVKDPSDTVKINRVGPETCILTQTILTLVKHLSFATNRSLHSFIIYDIIFFLFFSKKIKTVKTGVCFGGLYSLEEITSKKGEDCGAIRNLVGIRGDGPGGDMGEEARLDTGEDKVGRTGRLALPATRVSPPSSHASTL